MRSAPLAALVLVVGCGPGVDPLVGTFNFAVTGTDTNTAPNTNVSNPTGSGTLAITPNAAQTGYVISAAQTDATPCVLQGTATEKATSPEITIKSDQKCVFVNGGTTTTVSFTSGKSVLKMDTTREKDVMTLDVAYAYAGTTVILGFSSSFAGNGKRTYTGTRR